MFSFFVFSGSKFRYPKYLLFLIPLSIYYFIWNIVNGELDDLSPVEIINYIYHFRWIYLICFLILVENTFFDDKFISDLVVIIKVTIVLAFIFSFIQLIYDPSFFTPDELRIRYLLRSQYNMRLTSIFGFLSWSELGISFVPLVSILIGYYLHKKIELHYLWLVLAGLVIFSSKSRWVYLNFIVILMQYPLVKGIDFRKVLRLSIIGVFTIVASILILQSVGFYITEFIEQRLLSETASTRLLAIEMFTNFFPKNPFFGSGLHVSEELSKAIGGRSSQIHVGYLSHLYEYGIVGTLFIFGFWILIFKDLYITARRSNYYGSLFAFIAFLVANLTLVYYSIFYYGLLITFIFNKYFKDQYFESTET